jgi:chemotaxis methyl-accepting protein methylase
VDLDGHAQGELEKVIVLLRARTGRDFSPYKKRGVYRRIERRMHIHQIDRMAAYINYLRENPAELDLLFKELLIGVTTFFRDPQAWRHVREESLPALLKSSPEGVSLRAWVTGCSTGEEAYSLAITFTEALRQVNHQGRHTLQIFATDLDRDAIDRARRATYPANIAADVGPERLNRYFIEENGDFRVRNEIREMVTFAPHDVLLDAPFTKLDLLACRNLLIYLEPGAQQKLIKLFHYSIKPGGFLLLGSAETVGRQEGLFEAVDGKARLYRRRPGDPAGAAAADFAGTWLPMAPQTRTDVKTPDPPLNLQSLADRLLLQRFSPAAVLVNAKGDIVYVSGRTGKYLELPAGKVNWNIYALAREELRGPLTSALNQVLRKNVDVTVRAITVGTNGGQQTFDLRVHPIAEPIGLSGLVMILFTDVASGPAPERHGATRGPKTKTVQGRLAEAERALRQAQEETVHLREDMQSAQEELKSTNEELQSTNEELQSTNEELTTSKEEMQSMNEELQTVNAELQSKVDDLTRASSDMRNLLDSTDIVTVFLDASLRVRRFTLNATQVFKLIPGDTGRPLSDIVTDLEYRELAQDAQRVLRMLAFSEKLIDATGGRRFKVRIMPYRTLDNVIDGVVITCVNITEYLSLLASEAKGRPS